METLLKSTHRPSIEDVRVGDIVTVANESGAAITGTIKIKNGCYLVCYDGAESLVGHRPGLRPVLFEGLEIVRHIPAMTGCDVA